ncbi:MAG: penicillin-binding transpeptidase domain-containing protein, partial [Planctomycetota bacterium]|nr:penicillin-binding transpeptidase domain-containing protein [Planctomycetota bacterium]
VLVVITAQMVVGVVEHPEDTDYPRRNRVHVSPTWAVLDREGKTIAGDVRKRVLEMSPRAMWQSHTPQRIAEGLNSCLNAERRIGPRAVFDLMVPDAVDGVIQVSGAKLQIDQGQMRLVEAWSDELEEGVSAASAGLWTERDLTKGHWTLAWMPELLLSEEMRKAQGQRSPLLWTMNIADRLATILFKEEVGRGEIWKLLMHDRNQIVFDDLSFDEIERIEGFLESEGVADHQMSFVWQRQREYPVTDGLDPSGAGYSWLGSWKYKSWEWCQEKVAAAHGFDSFEDVPAQDKPAALQEVRELAARRQPLSGVEIACQDLLESKRYGFLKPEPGSYSYGSFHVAHQGGQRHFLEEVEEEETPRFSTTIDAHLQGFLHEVLGETLDEHDAALSMGIVVEVRSGEVLAIDAVSQYQIAEFAPTYFPFTPGSTFKPIIVCAALDAGVVQPEDRFKTYNRKLSVGALVEGCRRRPIGEARNSMLGDDGTLSLREGLAHSVNAVLVQVGLKLSSESLHSTLLNLGYGQRLKTVLGESYPGRMTDFDRWDRCYTQASVSFGHEIECTLFQHAASLATIVRGGEYKPLRVLTSVESGGKRYALQEKPSHTVFSGESCDEVRDIMRMAAQVGTGRRLVEPLMEDGVPLVIGCKTGTTQKEHGTTCSHLERACAEEKAIERGKRDRSESFDSSAVNRDCHEHGRSATPPHEKDCYTASMVAFGSVGDPSAVGPRAGETREVMVFIVVDEPRGERYYGSQVAGPAVIKVLQEALGLTMDGQRFLDGGIPEERGGSAADLELSDYPVLDALERGEGR